MSQTGLSIKNFEYLSSNFPPELQQLVLEKNKHTVMILMA